jgi:hypothetical protein
MTTLHNLSHFFSKIHIFVIFESTNFTKMDLGVVLGPECNGIIQNPIFPWQHNITSHNSTIFNLIHLKLIVHVLDIMSLINKIFPKFYIKVCAPNNLF